MILVHGLLGNMTDTWPTMSPLLKNNGYCVFALTYGTDPSLGFPLDQLGGLRPIEQSAAKLSRYDELVVPYTSGTLPAPNATNIVLQKRCTPDLSDHLSSVAARNSARRVLDALDPAHAKPVPCVPVLPVV